MDDIKALQRTKKEFREYAKKEGLVFLGVVNKMPLDKIISVLATYKSTGHEDKLLAMPRDKVNITKSGVLERGDSKSELRLSKHDAIYKSGIYWIIREEFGPANITVLYI